MNGSLEYALSLSQTCTQLAELKASAYIFHKCNNNMTSASLPPSTFHVCAFHWQSLNYNSPAKEVYFLGPCERGASACYHWNKIPEIINLKGRMMYFGSQFQRPSSWSLGPVVLDLWWHSTSWLAYMVKEACSPHGGQQAKKKAGAGVLVFSSRSHWQWHVHPLGPIS